MLLGELINRIKTIMSKGVSSDDFSYSDRFIYSVIRTYRSSILKKMADNNKYISDANYSNSVCLKLAYDSLFECPCVADTDCKYPTSVYALPSIISSSYGLLGEIRTVDGLKLDHINLDESRWNQYSRTKKSTSGFFFHNSKLVVVGHSRLKIAVVRAVWNNPLALADIPQCNDSGDDEPNNMCYSPLQQEFPLEESLIIDLLNLTYTELIKLGLSVRRDLTNDSQDNAGPPDANQRIREF